MRLLQMRARAGRCHDDVLVSLAAQLNLAAYTRLLTKSSLFLSLYYPGYYAKMLLGKVTFIDIAVFLVFLSWHLLIDVGLYHATCEAINALPFLGLFSYS